MDHNEEQRACQRQLAELQEGFPGFRIWREVTGERTRLVAVRRHRGISPHTVVTADAAELRAVLNGGHRHTPATPATGQLPTPSGHDVITLAAPDGRHLCNGRAHNRAGTVAEVIVTFGKLGSEPWHRDSLWPECWGRSYPMCGPCWDTTRQTAYKTRPHLVIRDARPS